MKKIFNLILASSVALGFAACNNDRAQNGPDNQGEKTAVQFRVSEVKTRTLPQGDVAGQGGESTVASAKFITSGGDLLMNMNLVGSSTTEYESSVMLYEGATGPGIKSAFILNLPNGINANATTPTQMIEIEKLGDVAKAEGFTMSSKTKEIEIKENVAEGAVDDENNLFAYEVERLVSKVQVTKAQNAPIVEGSVEGVGTFSDFSYAVAGGAKKLYLYGDNAGVRTLGDPSKKYDGFKSAIHESQPASTFSDGDFVKRRDLTRVSDKSLVAPFVKGDAKAQFTNFASLPVRETAEYNNASVENGIFFFENSLDLDVNAKGMLKFADITYVKMYAKMAAAAEKVIKEVEEDNSYVYASAEEVAQGGTDKLAVTKEYYMAHKAEDEFKTKFVVEGVEGEEGTKYFLNITNKPGTFYKGANGKLYLTLTASRADGNEKSEKFSEGKMVWWVPANSQLDATNAFTKYADTRRNNIYALNIEKITGLGHNYDPLDPTDPNILKPGEGDNPDEPEKKKDIDVDPTETHIKVKATILNWNLVHRGVELK